MDFADLITESCHSLGKLYYLQIDKKPLKNKQTNKTPKLPMEYLLKYAFSAQIFHFDSIKLLHCKFDLLCTQVQIKIRIVFQKEKVKDFIYQVH